MNGGFGGRNHNTAEEHLSYSLPNGSIQPQYVNGSSSRALRAQEVANLTNLRGSFMGNDGSDHIPVQLGTTNGVLNSSHSIGQNVYDINRNAPGQMGATNFVSLTMGISQPQGIGHIQQIGMQYGDVQQSGNPSANIGPIRESNITSYSMAEISYRGGGSSGSIGSQSIHNNIDSSANTQYMDIHDISIQNSYLSSQSQPRTVSKARSISHPRAQSQPISMVQQHQYHQQQQQQQQQQVQQHRSQQQVQRQNQQLNHQQYFHSQQQYIQSFPQSQTQTQNQTQIHSQSQPQPQPQPQNKTPNQTQTQVHSQTQILSQSQPQSRSHLQPQSYYSHNQQNNILQPPSHPRTHPLPHPYSQGNPGHQVSSQKSSIELSQPHRHSSSSNLHPNLASAQGSHLQQSFQSFSSSNLGQRQVGNSLKGNNHGISAGSSTVYNKVEETGVGTVGVGASQYRSKPYSQQSHKYASQQQINSSSSALHPSYVQSYSQGSSSSIGGLGETDSKAMTQHISTVGYKTSNIDLGVCSFQVNVPNNISDELRNSIIRLVPKEQLNSVLFLVSSLISKNIHFREFHARLIAILRSSQLVEILENMLRDYFQQNNSSSHSNHSGIVIHQGLSDSRNQISHPSISQISGGRSDYFTVSQSQYTSGMGSSSQMYDCTLLNSMISHAHSKKSISRHGGHYNMHAKEDILLQMLKHARSKSATSLIGIDITGPSSYISKLISNKTIQNKSMVSEEESISPDTLSIYREKLNNYGRYLLSCDSSLNLKFVNSGQQSAASRLGRIVKFETQPDLEKSVFSTQAVKTIHKLASFYVRDILKFILNEENISNEKLNYQDFEGGRDKREILEKLGKNDRLAIGDLTGSDQSTRLNQMESSKAGDIVAKNSSSSNSCNFGMGKSIGGKGLGMKLTFSGSISSVKPVMITSLWSCIYKSLRYNMNRYNECEPNAFHNIIIKNRPGHSRDQCSNYILIPESMYRSVESWLLSNAYNQWDKLSIL
ncbi:uncharacterized protein ELE39_002989 [Cryptosporidium sp. chipmunk genotype I]|uniref:uncharacterized protein n=1 Tax=Cryptosporidium sp. chipmunk genotype I TaxID=1280935 RepID=UPI003519DE81|nr:hypothetical protein ELE39_002989 [Cryptosporidium sp. chipmunk genotype I]